MSLKAFHVVFITLAIALVLWLGWWSVGQARGTGELGWWGLAGLCAAGAVGLVAYEVWFLRKTRGVSAW
jgi:hypothetical protein